MKKILLFMMLSVGSYCINAQDLKSYQHYGKVIMKDGTTKEGIIETNLDHPWLAQKEIKFFDAELLKKEKIKNKEKEEFKAKDIQGFEFDDKVYSAQKFADLSSLGMSSFGAMFFLEVLQTGKIAVYKFYDTPSTVITGQTIEDAYAEIKNAPRYLLKKGDEKIGEPVTFSQLEKYVSDCPAVMDKLKAGAYGNHVIDDDKTAAGKFLAAQVAPPTEKALFLDVIFDYNTEMGGQ